MPNATPVHAQFICCVEPVYTSNLSYVYLRVGGSYYRIMIDADGKREAISMISLQDIRKDATAIVKGVEGWIWLTELRHTSYTAQDLNSMALEISHDREKAVA